MLSPTIIANKNSTITCTAEHIASFPSATLGTRVLCLYRVSSDKQLYYDDQHNVDIPMQRIRCREYAASQGWSIVYELQEEGISGYKVRAADRDKIQLIKEYALNKQFDILLVFMFDRIGRIADETPFVVEWLVNHGIRVISVSEGEQKFESHTDRLLNYIRFWQADGESQKTSIRTANSLRILTEQGHFTGGVCPYGYSFVKKGRTNKRKHEVYDLAICEDEALVVTLMFTLAATEGYGAQRIANHLYKVGIKNRSDRNWHPATIRGILKNILYTGVLRSGDSRSEVIPELQIIDIPTFDKVQGLHLARSKSHAQTRTVPGVVRSSALLSGFIFCGDCGARLHVTTCGKGRRRADGTDVMRTRYACQTKTRSHGECAGQSVYIHEKIDSAVENQVFAIFAKLKRLSRRDAVNACLTTKIREKESIAQCARQSYEKARNDYLALQEELVKSLSGNSAFSQEMIKAVIYRRQCDQEKALSDLSEAEKRVEDTRKQAATISRQFDELMEWARSYSSASLDAKRMILYHIIERVDVFRNYQLNITFTEQVQQFLSTLHSII